MYTFVKQIGGSQVASALTKFHKSIQPMQVLGLYNTGFISQNLTNNYLILSSYLM